MKPFQTIAPFAASLTRASLAGVRLVGDALSSDSPKAFFRRFAVLPYSVNATKVGACLLAAAFLGAGASINQVLACGVPTQIPTGPFINQSNADFRMLYSEVWTKLRLSPKTSLEVGAIFTPVPNYSNSRVLGPDWRLTAIEATASPINDREYEMILPSGHREHLERSKTPNQLRGSGWIATLNGRDLIAKSSCGNELRYQAGRLKVWKTSDGVEVLFNRDAQGNYSVMAGKTVVLSLKPAYDANTRKIYHLNLQGGKHAILRLGTRPVLVKTSEKDTFGGNKEKRMDALTLTSIQWDGESERKYGFGLDTLTIAGDRYVWHRNTSVVAEERGNKIEFERIMGINCLKTIMQNGDVFVSGRDERRGISVDKVPNGEYQITEIIPNGNLYGRIRRISTLSAANSVPVLKKQYWYDENGEVKKIQQQTPEGKILMERTGLLTRAKNLSSGEVLWEKKMDEKSRVTYFKYGKDEYTFDYEKSLTTGIVLLTAKNGGQTQKKEIPLSQVSLLLSTEH